MEGAELAAELSRMGYEPDPMALYNLLFRLRDDGGYVSFYAAAGGVEAISFIRLGEAGRQEVEGWPRSSSISTADAEALLRAFEERANDEAASDAERSRVDTAAEALRDVGVEVTGSVITSWLRTIGIG